MVRVDVDVESSVVRLPVWLVACSALIKCNVASLLYRSTPFLLANDIVRRNFQYKAWQVEMEYTLFFIIDISS